MGPLSSIIYKKTFPSQTHTPMSTSLSLFMSYSPFLCFIFDIIITGIRCSLRVQFSQCKAFVSPLICTTEALQIKGIADRKTVALLATGLRGWLEVLYVHTPPCKTTQLATTRTHARACGRWYRRYVYMLRTCYIFHNTRARTVYCSHVFSFSRSQRFEIGSPR